MSNSQPVDLKSTVLYYLGKLRSVVGEGDWSDGERSKEFAEVLCDHLIVLVNDEPTLDLKSVTGHMAKLQSVLDKGNWSAQSSKELADLLCVHLLKLVKKLPCTSTTTHGELDRSESGRATEAVSADPEVITEKKRTLDPEVITEKERDAEAVTEKKRASYPEVTTEKERDAETVTEKKMASGVMTKRVFRKRQGHDRDDIQESYFPSWKPNKCKRISRKSDEPRIEMVKREEGKDENLMFIIDDGYTWNKCGEKEIKDGNEHHRHYFQCAAHKKEGCPAKKQVRRIDSHQVEILYFHHHHNCKHDQTTLPTNDGSGSGSSRSTPHPVSSARNVGPKTQLTSFATEQDHNDNPQVLPNGSGLVLDPISSDRNTNEMNAWDEFVIELSLTPCSRHRSQSNQYRSLPDGSDYSPALSPDPITSDRNIGRVNQAHLMSSPIKQDHNGNHQVLPDGPRLVPVPISSDRNTNEMTIWDAFVTELSLTPSSRRGSQSDQYNSLPNGSGYSPTLLPDPNTSDRNIGPVNQTHLMSFPIERDHNGNHHALSDGPSLVPHPISSDRNTNEMNIWDEFVTELSLTPSSRHGSQSDQYNSLPNGSGYSPTLLPDPNTSDRNIGPVNQTHLMRFPIERDHNGNHQALSDGTSLVPHPISSDRNTNEMNIWDEFVTELSLTPSRHDRHQSDQ